jgi:hypothetical protein
MQNRAPRVQTDTASSLFSPRSSSPSPFNDTKTPQISIDYAIQRAQCPICLSIHCLSGTGRTGSQLYRTTTTPGPAASCQTSHSLMYQKFPISVTSDTPRWCGGFGNDAVPRGGHLRCGCRPVVLDHIHSGDSQTRPPKPCMADTDGPGVTRGTSWGRPQRNTQGESQGAQ